MQNRRFYACMSKPFQDKMKFTCPPHSPGPPPSSALTARRSWRSANALSRLLHDLRGLLPRLLLLPLEVDRDLDGDLELPRVGDLLSDLFLNGDLLLDRLHLFLPSFFLMI